MKKNVFALVMMLGLVLVSCKQNSSEEKKALDKVTKELQKEASKIEEKVEASVKEVSENIKSAIEGITIPKFEDPKVDEFLTDYVAHVKEVMASEGKSAVAKAKMSIKSMDFMTKTSDVAKDLDEQSTKKFNEAIASIRAMLNKATE